MLSRLILAISFLTFFSGAAFSQGLSLLLPKNPRCTNWSTDIDKIDQTGCIAIDKSVYAVGPNNSPDLGVLEEYRHADIKNLTYHHTALAIYKENGDVDVQKTVELLKKRPFSMGIGKQVKNIQSGHIKRDGTPMFESGGTAVKWGDIAYHYIVDQFGNIVEGRSIEFRPASGTIYNGGTKGHLTVVIIGNYDYQELTDAGLLGIVRVLSAGQRKFRVPSAKIGGHKEYASTGCPGKHIYERRDEIKKMTLAYSIQRELADRGCNPGVLDGRFGTNSSSALTRLKQTNPSMQLIGVSDSTLWELLDNPNAACS